MYIELSRAELVTKIVDSILKTDNDFTLNTFITLG